MSSILTNTSAMVALDTLRGINKNLGMVQSEISTGKKVATAQDNAAIWAISTVMSSDVDSFSQISDSLNTGSATVGVARSASEDITSFLTEIKTKIASAQGDTLNDNDRSKIQSDIDALVTQIDSAVSGAQFNGVNLLSSGGSVNFLSSLDRGSDGSVTANTITVNRSNLSQSAAVNTLADATATDGGFAVAAGDIVADQITTAAAASSTDATATITLNGTGALADGDEVTVTIGNNTFTSTAVAANGDDLNDIGADLASQINAAGITGITAEFIAIDPDDEAATLVISNSSTDAGDQQSITVASRDTNGDLIVGAVGESSIAGLEGSGDIEATVTFEDGAILVGEEFTITVGADDYTYTAIAGDDLNDVGAELVDLINDAGDPKLSASFTSITVGEDATITVNYDADDADDQVAITSSTDSAAVVTDTATTGVGQIEAAAVVAQDNAEATVTLNAGSLAAGDVFSMDIGGETVSYTATADDTIDTVGAALAQAVNDAGVTDVTASYVSGGDPATDDGTLTITNASTTTAADFELTQTQKATVSSAAGSLNGLSDIDVTSEAGATAALNDIEGFLQSAIDASSAFGSSQNRISNQVEFVNTLSDSLKTGIGALTDANLEEASARLQSLQVQQQLGVQALSIANSGPQQLLALFR